MGEEEREVGGFPANVGNASCMCSVFGLYLFPFEATLQVNERRERDTHLYRDGGVKWVTTHL